MSVCGVCVVCVTHPKVVVAQGVWDEGASMAWVAGEGTMGAGMTSGRNPRKRAEGDKHGTGRDPRHEEE